MFFKTIVEFLSFNPETMAKKYLETNQLVNIFLHRKAEMSCRVIIGCRIKKCNSKEISVYVPKDNIYRLGYQFDEDFTIQLTVIKRISVYEPGDYYDYPHRLGF